MLAEIGLGLPAAGLPLGTRRSHDVGAGHPARPDRHLAALGTHLPPEFSIVVVAVSILVPLSVFLFGGRPARSR
jgi:hypothetical protein